jgi:hypothetical protein
MIILDTLELCLFGSNHMVAPRQLFGHLFWLCMGTYMMQISSSAAVYNRRLSFTDMMQLACSAGCCCVCYISSMHVHYYASLHALRLIEKISTDPAGKQAMKAKLDFIHKQPAMHATRVSVSS